MTSILFSLLLPMMQSLYASLLGSSQTSRTPLNWIGVGVMLRTFLSFKISCVWLIRNTSIGFLFQSLLRGNSSSPLIMDSNAPSLGLAPVNQLLVSTLETLSFVCELLPMCLVALQAVINQWYARAFILAVHEEWTPLVVFLSPDMFLLPALLLLLSMLVLVNQHLGCHTSARSSGTLSSLVSALPPESVGRYLRFGVDNSRTLGSFRSQHLGPILAS